MNERIFVREEVGIDGEARILRARDSAPPSHYDIENTGVVRTRNERVIRVEELDRYGRPVEAERVRIIREQVVSDDNLDFAFRSGRRQTELHRDERKLVIASNLLDRKHDVDSGSIYFPPFDTLSMLIVGPVVVTVLYFLRTRLISRQSKVRSNIMRSEEEEEPFMRDEAASEAFSHLKSIYESDQLMTLLSSDSGRLIHELKVAIKSLAKETDIRRGTTEIRVNESSMHEIEFMTKIFTALFAYTRQRGNACSANDNISGQVHWIQIELLLINICKDFTEVKIRLNNIYHKPYERAEKQLKSVLESENVSKM